MAPSLSTATASTGPCSSSSSLTTTAEEEEAPDSNKPPLVALLLRLLPLLLEVEVGWPGLCLRCW
jgi:hypothetical protein